MSLEPSGRILGKSVARFKQLEELADAYESVVAELKSAVGERETLWSLGLEKPQRLVIAPRNAHLNRVSLVPEVVQPALSSMLLGAIPEGPGLLVSLSKEVRFALVDSTLTYREYRFNEGGGIWWQRQIPELATHSTRLQTHLADFPNEIPLKFVPRLLELGRFPTPDPVLKPKLEKVAQQLTDMIQRVTSRLPGLKRYCLSGFLAKSSLGDLISELLSEQAPHLRAVEPTFPPEVGSALIVLAQERENWERDHLKKDAFQQDRTVDEWTPPKVLLRRLYKLRKPFEEYHR